MLVGGFSTVVGALVGLVNFQDVGYPDSADLIRIEHYVRSGRIYSDYHLPPYLAITQGPLTYVLLGIPYAVAEAFGFKPQLLVRFTVLCSFVLCSALVFMLSRRLYDAPAVYSWLSILFAVSVLPLASWVTQIRSDFLALGFSLLSIHLFLRANRPWHFVVAAICSGLAPLVKPTFIAAPVSVLAWLLYKDRWKQGGLWVTSVSLTIVSGYAVVFWREPLAMTHIAALTNPVLEYRGALALLGIAGSQPLVPFAALGAFRALRDRHPERLLFLFYCLAAWFVAIMTIPHAGGNINYFWEPLLTSAVLAGPGLGEAQREARRRSGVFTDLLVVLLLWLSVPVLRHDLAYLKTCLQELRSYERRKDKWDVLVSVVGGRRLLSTIPSVTRLSSLPEVPDPYLNSSLELRGKWSYAPVLAALAKGQYELVVVGKGQADDAGYRGVKHWSGAMWNAMKRTYRRACTFEGLEIWLPRQQTADFPLERIDCEPH